MNDSLRLQMLHRVGPWSYAFIESVFAHEFPNQGIEDHINNNLGQRERPAEEIGDIPMTLAGNNLSEVMKEVPLANGSGVVPIQLMWSNAVGGPEGPISKP